MLLANPAVMIFDRRLLNLLVWVNVFLLLAGTSTSSATSFSPPLIPRTNCSSTELADINKILVSTGLLLQNQRAKEAYSVWFLNPDNIVKACPTVFDRFDLFNQSPSDERFQNEVMLLAHPFYLGFVDSKGLPEGGVEAYLKKSRLILAYESLEAFLQSIKSVDQVLTKGYTYTLIEMLVQQYIIAKVGLAKGVIMGGAMHVFMNFNFPSNNITANLPTIEELVKELAVHDDMWSDAVGTSGSLSANVFYSAAVGGGSYFTYNAFSNWWSDSKTIAAAAKEAKELSELLPNGVVADVLHGAQAGATVAQASAETVCKAGEAVLTATAIPAGETIVINNAVPVAEGATSLLGSAGELLKYTKAGAIIGGVVFIGANVYYHYNPTPVITQQVNFCADRVFYLPLDATVDTIAAKYVTIYGRLTAVQTPALVDESTFPALSMLNSCLPILKRHSRVTVTQR